MSFVRVTQNPSSLCPEQQPNNNQQTNQQSSQNSQQQLPQHSQSSPQFSTNGKSSNECSWLSCCALKVNSLFPQVVVNGHSGK